MVKKNKNVKKNTIDNNFQTIIIDEVKYKTLFNKKYLIRKSWEPTDPSLLISFIPGIVGKIFVAEGEKLEKGDKILTLEAMKMKNIITAPYSGFIKKINVKEGQAIPKGMVMVELEIKQQNK